MRKVNKNSGKFNNFKAFFKAAYLRYLRENAPWEAKILYVVTILLGKLLAVVHKAANPRTPLYFLGMH